MVVNISKILSNDWIYIENEIKSATKIIHNAEQKIIIIFENCCLNNEQKIKLCRICGELNVDWIKTSTGYYPGGATIEDVILMRKHTPSNIQVKAADGIGDFDTLIKYIELGVTRVGASKTVEILKETKNRLGMCVI